MDFIVIWLAFAIVTAIIASNKGRSGLGWLILGAIFGIFALIVIVVISSVKPQPVVAGGEVATAETHVRCPECRELVRNDAKRCKHCQATLTPAA
mgnify:CR=1 FL=1